MPPKMLWQYTKTSSQVWSENRARPLSIYTDKKNFGQFTFLPGLTQFSTTFFSVCSKKVTVKHLYREVHFRVKKLCISENFVGKKHGETGQVGNLQQ